MPTAVPFLLALQLAGDLPSAWLGLPLPGIVLALALLLAMPAARSRRLWHGVRRAAIHWRRRKEAALKVREAVHTKGGPSQRLATKPLHVGGQQKNSFVRHTSTRSHGFWLRRSLKAGLLMGIAAAARAAPEAPFEPLDEIEAFTAEGAAGTLVLPAGSLDRQTPGIVVLQDGEQPDGRAARYTDQPLGLGFAVLETFNLPDDGLAKVLACLALRLSSALAHLRRAKRSINFPN